MLVEPGVTFYDIIEHFESNNMPLTLDMPDPAWGSLIGNALERGMGHTYSQHGRDRWSGHCGMEVVLPTGDMIRTGPGASGNDILWQDQKYGIGPDVHGIFTQSNFGVITKMGFWIRPAHEGFRHARIHVPRFDDIHKLIELDTRLHNMEICNGMSVVASPLYGSFGPMLFMPPVTDPEHLALLEVRNGERPDPGPLASYGERNRLAFWWLELKFHGPNSVTQAQWDYAKDLFSREIPGCWFEEFEPLEFPLSEEVKARPEQLRPCRNGQPRPAQPASLCHEHAQSVQPGTRCGPSLVRADDSEDRRTDPARAGSPAEELRTFREFP